MFLMSERIGCEAKLIACSRLASDGTTRGPETRADLRLLNLTHSKGSDYFVPVS